MTGPMNSYVFVEAERGDTVCWLICEDGSMFRVASGGNRIVTDNCVVDRDALGVSTRSSAGAGPSGLGVSEGELGMRLSSRATPRSMSSGALVEVQH